jgi:hypothetical protein
MNIHHNNALQYAECYYAECRNTECHYAECRYAECRYAECRYAECRYAECRYAECWGAVLPSLAKCQSVNKLMPSLLRGVGVSLCAPLGCAPPLQANKRLG